MIMDYLRSCYTSQIRPFKNDNTLVSVRWYWAPPGAKDFPGWHSFGSSVWDHTKPFDPAVGEQGSAFRLYDKGALPGPVDGQKFCGRLDDFLGDGKPGNATFSFGVRDCCTSGMLHACCMMKRTINWRTFPETTGFPPCGGMSGLSGTFTFNSVTQKWEGVIDATAVCGITIACTIDLQCVGTFTTSDGRTISYLSQYTTITCVPLLLENHLAMRCPTNADPFAAWRIEITQ